MKEKRLKGFVISCLIAEIILDILNFGHSLIMVMGHRHKVGKVSISPIPTKSTGIMVKVMTVVVRYNGNLFSRVTASPRFLGLEDRPWVP